MSRIAKAPIELPSGVNVTISGQNVAVKVTSNASSQRQQPGLP